MSGEIYAAMAKAMKEVGSIGKTRKNAQQGYQFRGIDDVIAHVQSVMAECGIVMVPEVLEREREMLATKAGGTMASVRLLVKHTFYAKDGSSVAATTLGEAMDAGDKAANKAMSAALKYALTESLLIPTYEADRDTEDASPEIAAQPKTPQTQREMVDTLRASIDQIEQRRGSGNTAVEALFPNYGKAKGQPVRGADVATLQYYLSGAKRSLADPGKARFHEQEAKLAAAIEAEIQRQAKSVNHDVYSAVEERAAGFCECGCGRPFGIGLKDRPVCDHFFGRAKAPERVETCWRLRADHDRDKTDNFPTAAFWLAKFALHCTTHGYEEEKQRAKDKLAWLQAKGVVR